MKIYQAVMGAVCCLAVGCATAEQRAADPQYRAMNHSAVMGTIALPTNAASCSGVEVNVYTQKDNLLVAHAAVTQSRARCTYSVSQLPADVALNVQVKPSSDWQCENGSPAALKPQAQEVRLQDYETRTQDFSASCARS